MEFLIEIFDTRQRHVQTAMSNPSRQHRPPSRLRLRGTDRFRRSQQRLDPERARQRHHDSERLPDLRSALLRHRGVYLPVPR
ncbi:ORF035 [Saltwater crocodilepox virus]|nr:hypothetical protein [Saltwater crocodilepox virus]AVD69372.1 hypothetical protein [Saltwater crocodilepox virus]QGT46474.1 ORF035 [Saltwater crocodilepox virus]QGT46690.1 ORF035 [Saltwater crocodilepox virus]QGT46907.1 ORF035 [Saltwater crocodilepox virus]